jgi:hypothetical protein
MPLLEPDSDGSDEVFMVGQGDPPTDQTEAETAQAAEAKIAQAARLAREADKAARKRHHSQQDDSGASEDEDEDGAASKGAPHQVQTAVPGRPRPTLRSFSDSARGTQVDRVARRSGLPHAGTQCFGLLGYN